MSGKESKRNQDQDLGGFHPINIRNPKGSIMTAYQFSKIVNRELAALGIEKVLPPQMFYTYYKKNFIKAEARTETGAAEWAYKYASKHFADAMV
jgi:hypothetical protein